jgi:hypothetical protein
MYDSAKKELVWRGTASKTVAPHAKPEKQQKIGSAQESEELLD